MNGLNKFGVICNPLDQDFRQLDVALIIKETPGVFSLAIRNIIVLGLSTQMRILNEISFMGDGMAFSFLDAERLRSTR